MTLSDRIAVMARGKVLQIATPKEIYTRPADLEVASFIGQMNFFECKVEKIENEEIHLHAAGLGRIRAENSPLARPGGDVIAAVRPEKLRVSGGKPAPGENCARGVIAAAAYLGDRSHYHVRVDGCSKPVAVATQDGSGSSTGHLAEGSSVWISWTTDALLLLEKGDA